MCDENRGDLYWAKQVDYHLIGVDGTNYYRCFMGRMNQAIDACNKIENNGMRNGYMLTINLKLRK